MYSVGHPTVHACPFLRSWGCPFRPPCTSMAVDQPLFNKTCRFIYSAIESNCSCAPSASTAFGPPESARKLRCSLHTSTPQGVFFAAHPFVTPPFPMLHGAVGHGHCVCAYNPRSCFTFSTNQPCPVQTPAFKVGRMPLQSSFEIPPQADGAHRTNTRTGPLHLLIVATAYRSRECQKC